VNLWPFISREHHEAVVKQLEIRLTDKDALLKEREAELAQIRPLLTIMPTRSLPIFPPAKPTDDYKRPFDHLGERVPGVPLPGEEPEEDHRQNVTDGASLRPRVLVRRASRAMATDYASQEKASVLKNTFDTIEREVREAQEKAVPVETPAAEEQKAG
jgi:hypothetical protein